VRRREGASGGRGGCERGAWLREKVEASVFARVLQDTEDRCLNCVRLVLQGEGWPARSWKQDGLLVEDMDGRRLHGGDGGGEPAVARLEAALRKAEAAVLAQEGMEVGLLVKDFFDGPVEAVLQRMAGPGGRRPATAEARGAARQARAAGAAGGGRAPPPPRTLPAVARAAAAAARAAAAGLRLLGRNGQGASARGITAAAVESGKGPVGMLGGGGPARECRSTVRCLHLDHLYPIPVGDATEMGYTPSRRPLSIFASTSSTSYAPRISPRQSGAAGPCKSTLHGGARQGQDRRLRYILQSAAPTGPSP